MRPAAGWYPDAHDRDLLRWWDGSRWTERTHSAEGALPAVDDTRPPMTAASTSAGEVQAAAHSEPSTVAKPPAAQQPSPQQPVAQPSARTTAEQPTFEQPTFEQPTFEQPGAQPHAEPSTGWPTSTWTPPPPARQTQSPLPSAPPPSTPPLSTTPPGARPAPAPLVRADKRGEIADPGRRLAARLVDGTVMLVLTMICALPWTADYLAAVQAHVTPGSFDLAGLMDDAGFVRYANAQTLISLVVDGPVSWAAAFARWALWMPLGQFTANVWLIVDGGWCLFDRRRQCLHDKFVRTIVVNASADPGRGTQVGRR
jgi:uncharacterized RDD family membrane protein YckC